TGGPKGDSSRVPSLRSGQALAAQARLRTARNDNFGGLASWAVIFRPFLRSFVVGSTMDLQIKSRGSYQGRLFSGAVRPNDELGGAGWRARAPAPHGHHPSVCTSTESTAGRSRTIGFQLSPASAEAYTWPPVVPK